MNQHGDPYRLEDDTPAYRTPGPGAAGTANRAYAVRCARCGYTLNGLTVGSFCPECGHQIGLGGASMDAQTSGFAIASLVLGILSILGCMLYGLPSLLLGSLAIWFAAKAKAQVLAGQAAPSSLGLSSAGKITGIIGLCLGGLYVLLIIGFIVLAGATAATFP